MKTITPTTSQMRMLASVRSQQWRILPDAIQNYALSALEIGERRADCGEDDDGLEDYYTKRIPAYIDSARIAHIEIKGALMDRCPAIYERWGLATRYSTIIAETESMRGMGAIGIVYHVDSPGGTVAGVIEAGAAISEVGIPTVAHCDGLACSAAYWLSAGTGCIIATPSATVGNIGAIVTWSDCTEFWAEMGITFKALVSEGADLKSTFHLEPDPAQIIFLQDAINEAGKAFRDHCSAGRAAAGATLDDEVFRAGWYSGERALALGLVDGIGPLSDAVACLTIAP